MKTFKQFIRENTALVSSSRTHMVHLTDAIIDGGVEGTRQAINHLRVLRDTLAGNTKTPMNISTKWDGCVHEDTVIYTDQGDLKISDLINKYQQGIQIKVMGRSFEGIPHDTFTQVIGESVSSGNKKWVEIELEDGSKIRMTEDHEVHTKNRGWIKAVELNENDDITEL